MSFWSLDQLILRSYASLLASLMFCADIIMLADVEFGRLQARDMLQHLWTGPISNASVDVVQGSRSVEVRSVGVTKVTTWLIKLKLLTLPNSQCTSTRAGCSLYDSFICIQGAAIDRILGEIVHSKSMTTPIDYVLCIGHFLGKVISATLISLAILSRIPVRPKSYMWCWFSRRGSCTWINLDHAGFVVAQWFSFNGLLLCNKWKLLCSWLGWKTEMIK